MNAEMLQIVVKTINNFFSPQVFVRASDSDLKKISIKSKKALGLLEKYDKGQVEIDYSAELKKLKEFARKNS